MARFRTDIAAFSAAAATASVAYGAVALEASPALAATLAAIAAATGAAIGVKMQSGEGRRDPETENKPGGAATPASAGPTQTDLSYLDALPAALALIDGERRLVYANGEAGRLFDVAAPGLAFATALRAPEVIEAVDRVLNGAEGARVVFNLKRRSGDRQFAASIAPVDGPNLGPGVARVLVFFEDLTRARQVETVRETFLANASHELKTPLASIIGFIETLQGPAKDDPAAHERFLGIMASQAERMRRLVDDLISLNRIEMNVNVAPRDRVDLGALAHETAAALAPLAEAAGATIAVETPKEGPVAPGDRDQISQLIANLVDNAVKYGGEGVSVRISQAPDSADDPGMIGLTVSDDGPGIAREHHHRLTERFYRVSASRSKAVGGTGLGLAIAKHVLQRHRGRLAVSSEPGVGSAFTIWLPKA